jgi:hypothetical protein
MTDVTAIPEEHANGTNDHTGAVGPKNNSKAFWTHEELHDQALEIIHELAYSAKKSNGDNDFDPGLPFEPRCIRALAYLQRKDVAEYNRAWTKLKEARPAPDLSILKSRIKSEVELQDAKEKMAGSNRANFKLDANYDTVFGLMEGIIDYKINESGGLSKVDFESIYDTTTGETTYVPIDKPICDFVAWPIREILKDDGEAKERYIELEGILPDSSCLPKVTISMSEFGEMKWPGLVWGMKAAIRPFREKELKFCLQKMSQSSIPESSVYTFLGWKKLGDNWIYLHAGGALGAENIKVELPPKLTNYRLPNKIPDLILALKATVALFDIGPAKIMYPLISMAFLSPLMEPFRQAGIEPGVLFYLWGTSGSRKSTIIALVLCLFGRFDNKTLPASFRDTSMSIEVAAFIAKDTLLPVDDLYPAQDPREQQKLNGVLEYTMRNQGDRQGRSRLVPGKSDYTLKSGHPPRGLIVASGEIQPLSGSSLARAYTSHICIDDLDKEKLKAAQDQKELLGQAMVGYLKWLAPQLDDLPTSLTTSFDELRNKARADTRVQGRHGRLDEAIADMYLGLEMFFKYAVDAGAITQEEADIHLKNGWEALNQGADEQTEMAHKNDVSQIFIQSIMELQSQHKVYFASMDSKTPVWDQEIMPKRRDLIGYGPDNDGIYYFLMDPAIKAVNELLRGQGENMVLRKDILLDSLEQKDLLATPPGKSRSYSKTITNKTRYITAIKGNAFDL